MESTGTSAQTRPGTAAGNGRYVPPPPGTRSAAQIRDDIVRERQDLARSVDALRGRWSEVTDVKRQLRAHRSELIVGAVAVGLLAGAVFAFSRRRR